MAYLLRGSAWIKKREFEKAIKDFDYVIQLDNQNAMAFSSRGYAWQLRGEIDKAVNDWTTAIQIDPRMSAAYICRGNVLREKEQIDEAIADFTKAIQIYAEDAETTPPDSNLAEAHCGRGYVRAAKGNYAEANEDFLQALQVDPAGIGPSIAIGWFRATCPEEKYRNGKEAVEFATKSCELSNWKDPTYLSNLAAACAEADDWDNAIAQQEQAINLASEEKDKAQGRETLELYRRKEPYRAKPLAKP
jgi:tetratricopeptide (TPR) repeat protein